MSNTLFSFSRRDRLETMSHYHLNERAPRSSTSFPSYPCSSLTSTSRDRGLYVTSVWVDRYVLIRWIRWARDAERIIEPPIERSREINARRKRGITLKTISAMIFADGKEQFNLCNSPTIPAKSIRGFGINVYTVARRARRMWSNNLSRAQYLLITFCFRWTREEIASGCVASVMKLCTLHKYPPFKWSFPNCLSLLLVLLSICRAARVVDYQSG